MAPEAVVQPTVSPVGPRILHLAVPLLCLIAAARVFIFSAGFPFFNNVDEQAHVDMVFRGSHGYLSHGLVPFTNEAAHYFALFYSPEYFISPGRFENRQFPDPIWKLPVEEQRQVVESKSRFWQSRLNPHSTEPPLYYWIAGTWLGVGQLAGISGGHLLYWIRFFNIIIAALLVWVGYAAATATFSERSVMRFAVPALLAFWPQSMFYAADNDVLSPLVFGIAFVLLIRFLHAGSPAIGLSLLAGICLSASGLIKTTNLVLFPVFVAFVATKCLQLKQRGQLRANWRALIAMSLSAALPLGVWMIWNYSVLGDLTGTTQKLKFLGWSYKPVTEWFAHPILTFDGFQLFFSTLMDTFWRGELIWHRQPLRVPAVDAFYWIGSAIVILGSLVRLLPRFRPSQTVRIALNLALAVFLCQVAFLATISMIYDFGSCPYPSRNHPYFTSGRLMTAAMVPWAIMIVATIEFAFSRAKTALPALAAIGCIVLVISASEIAANRPVLDSDFNFFSILRSDAPLYRPSP